MAGKDRVGADVLYLTGPEPDFRWPTFIEAVVRLVRDLEVRTVVGLGAFPAPTPHTRPVRLASTVPPQSVDLAGRVGTVHGTLEVPAGVQAALEVSLGLAGIPIIGLWARVPHYVSAMPYPEASAVLIEGLSAVTGAVLDSSALRAAGEASRRQVDELIGANPDHLEMVRRLEAGPRLRRGQPPGTRRGRSRAATRSRPSWSSSSEAKGTEQRAAGDRAGPALVAVDQVLGIDREEDQQAHDHHQQHPEHQPRVGPGRGRAVAAGRQVRPGRRDLGRRGAGPVG